MNTIWTIWKAQLSLQPLQQVEMPAGAEVLCAQIQFNLPCIWFRCNADAPSEMRTFALAGTGGVAPSMEEARYVGTVLLHGGSEVIHVFERKRT